MPRIAITEDTNFALFMALAKDPRPMWKIAADVGHSGAWLSYVMHGRKQASPEDRARIAAALGLPVSDLFPEPDAVPA